MLPTVFTSLWACPFVGPNCVDYESESESESAVPLVPQCVLPACSTSNAPSGQVDFVGYFLCYPMQAADWSTQFDCS